MLQTPATTTDTTVPPPVEWQSEGTLRLLDQTLLPLREEYIVCRTVEEVAAAVRALQVRGAPAIGVAAGYGLCLAAASSSAASASALLSDMERAAALLRATRPTAVNLGWALDEVLRAARSHAADAGNVRSAVLEAARRIDEANTRASLSMGAHGAALLRDGMNVLTHCNTGPLAAGGTGTALGAVYAAHLQGKRIHVWVDETRPVLQGARLTTWELIRWGVPCTLITDNMAASLMRAGRVDAVLVGADRIAANGDTANKIGTYGLAVLARAHGIPFYVIAPNSSIDLYVRSGEQITIEERHPSEVTHPGGQAMAPEGVAVYNPAFDVTPHALISSIITESGILQPPFVEAIKAATGGGNPEE